MKTDALIELLAAGSSVVDQRTSVRRFSCAVTLGLGASLVFVALLLGIRPNLDQAIQDPMFWGRLAFPCTLAAASLLITMRLSRPGLTVRVKDWVVLALPILLAWSVGGILLWIAPVDARWPLILGHSWKLCALLIGLISVPSVVAMVWAVRGMAPVRLRLAGAAMGLLSGALAAIAYCFHCPEMAPSFWSVWYLLGMVLPGVAGAIFGPRWLRW